MVFLSESPISLCVLANYWLISAFRHAGQDFPSIIFSPLSLCYLNLSGESEDKEQFLSSDAWKPFII